MAVTVSGGGTTTLTFNVTGSAATNYANALPGTFTAVYPFTSGNSIDTITGALNVIISTASTPDYFSIGARFEGGKQVTFVSSGDAFTVDGSGDGHDTVFGGADMTYVETADSSSDNLIVFTQGTNLFAGAPTGGFDDTIVGGSGYDTIVTAPGPATVFGGTGHTLAYLNDTTPAGGDIAVMQNGNTTVFADGLSDTVSATATGEVFGGAGTLTFVAPGTSSTLPITVVGGAGIANIFGGSNLDLTLSGGGIETFIAGAGNETLNGANSAGFSFFGSTDAGATTSVIGGNGDFFSTGAGTETYTAGSNDIFNIASVASANSITISDLNASDSVNFASPTVSSSTTDGTDYTVTLADGAAVEFVGLTSLPGHTT